ncbi:unnamed protein product [Ectocarpus fasciculatus]
MAGGGRTGTSNNHRAVEARYRPKHPFLSGGIAGGLEICLTFPFEYVKVQLQLQEKGKGTPRFKGPLHCATQTLRHSGVLGLYVGLPPWLTFALPRSAIRFTTFERVSEWLQEGQGKVDAVNALAAGTVAGAIESATCLTPLQNIQIKMMQMDRGFVYALGEILRREGLRNGFFSGLWPTVVKGAVNNCIRFGLYNETAAALRRSRGDSPDEALAAGAVFGLGAAAGAVSAVVTHPIDTVKSNLQGLSAGKYSGSLDCARQIMASSGVSGLFRGLSPRICRVCLEIGLQFSLYDSICRFMDKSLG